MLKKSPASLLDNLAQEEVEVRLVEFKLRGDISYTHADVADPVDGCGRPLKH